jgi:hypothetical protein
MTLDALFNDQEDIFDIFFLILVANGNNLINEKSSNSFDEKGEDFSQT